MMQTLLLLASRSAWSRKGSLLLLLLSVITSTCLLLGIDLARQSAKASFSNAVAGTDLIVGAQTSPVSLLLYSVFRIGQATRNVPYAEFERLEQDPRVKSALPIALGDSYRALPWWAQRPRTSTVFCMVRGKICSLHRAGHSRITVWASLLLCCSKQCWVLKWLRV